MSGVLGPDPDLLSEIRATYLKEKPGKSCPYCSKPFVKPAAAKASP